MDSKRWHDRLKARAKALGLTDAEVARRLDLSQARYSSYSNGRREPDFGTLIRICDVLLITPDALLGTVSAEPENLRMSGAISALRSLTPDTLEIAATILEALAKLPNRRKRREAPVKRSPTGARPSADRG